MKIFKIIQLIFYSLMILKCFNVYSQNPTYTLTVTNDTQTSAYTYEFDIYLLRTGSNSFQYAGSSQYFININPAIINGGSLSFTINPGTCGLNAIQQISTNTSFDAVNYRLRIAAQSPGGAGNGTIISNTPPGTKLGRFRVTNTVSFAGAQSNLTWYNFHSGFYTKVFAYVNNTNTEITDSTGHFININNNPLPVELSSFTSSVISNNVELNWVTQYEINNKGFSIERDNTTTNDTNWNSIGFIKGNGTTNHPSKYIFSDNKLNSGIYKYRLKQIDYNNNITIFNLQADVIIKVPVDFGLSQSYPNPSNPKSKIDYQVPSDGLVTIKVYDLIGREVVTLVNEYKKAGYYSTEFDGSNLASGVYIYRFKTSSFSDTKKMVLLK